MAWRIPLFDLDYDHREEEAVAQVLASRWLTMGEKTQEFERTFAHFVGAGSAFAVANGTAGLHLSVASLGLGPGDEVIVPDLTFVATANCVRYAGATPVLADIVGADDLTIDPADVRRKITPATKAVIVMHYSGYPCLMDQIWEIAKDAGIHVIEDAAHAPGTEWAGRKAGTLGDIAAFSFFSNKNLSCGEGGMVTTGDSRLAEFVRIARSHCMTAPTLDRHKGHSWSYDVVGTGFNYRMTEIEAALGLVQLSKLEEGNSRRRRLVERYRETLSSIPDLIVAFASRPLDGPEQRSSCHILEIVLPEGVDRFKVVEHLRGDGIQTSMHYRPIHTFSYPELASSDVGLEKVSAYANRLLTLPLYPAMTTEDVDLIAQSLSDAIREAG